MKNDDPEPAPPHDILWVTSQFSTRELHGQSVRIRWFRGGKPVGAGVYVMKLSNFGHSHHIQHIRAEAVEPAEAGVPALDFDQDDANRLHRTNESPKRFVFAADLELDRPRRQNPDLERLVLERRSRKVEPAGDWEKTANAVLFPASQTPDACRLSPALDENAPHAPGSMGLVEEQDLGHDVGESGGGGARASLS